MVGAATQQIESILVADCGTVMTKLLLLERVEESYRFVAQAEALTTINPPWNDVSVGVVRAIESLEEITGRTLYEGGQLITPQQGMRGVDAFVVILSAAKPLRVLLAGLVREMSLESAMRAASATYTHVVGMLQREGSLRLPEESWARAVRDLRPDVVLLVGGVDGGATRPVLELADAIALGISLLDEEERPRVVFAGNERLRPVISKRLGRIAQVQVVDNVRPAVETEHLGPAQELMESIYVEERLRRTPGIELLQAWSRQPITPTAAAFSRVIEYLWHRDGRQDRGTLGVDVGASSTTVAACFDGQAQLSVHAEHGLAFGPLEWARRHGIKRITRWLPEEMEEEDVWNILYNRQLFPWTVPQQVQELWVEQAIVREMLHGALELARPAWFLGGVLSEVGAMPPLDPILISGGGIVHMPRPGQALLTVLDGVQPVGISTLLLDINRAAPALGAVATIKPLAAVATLEAGTLVPLGTVISPVGKGRKHEVILKIKITYDDGGELNVEARKGELEIWPLLPGRRAWLDIKVNRRFDIGFGPGRGGRVEVAGGLVGLVVDGRGRPLELPEDDETRRDALRRWLWDVGG